MRPLDSPAAWWHRGGPAVAAGVASWTTRPRATRWADAAGGDVGDIKAMFAQRGSELGKAPHREVVGKNLA